MNIERNPLIDPKNGSLSTLYIILGVVEDSIQAFYKSRPAIQYLKSVFSQSL